MENAGRAIYRKLGNRSRQRGQPSLNRNLHDPKPERHQNRNGNHGDSEGDHHFASAHHGIGLFLFLLRPLGAAEAVLADLAATYLRAAEEMAVMGQKRS
jgi:hypothetical protein